MKTKLIKIKTAYRYIPTCLTLGNTVCGFTAILVTLQVYTESTKVEVSKLLATSAWLIGGAMIFDMLDGWTARKLHASSPYGVEMDSLADMVTFGVAPGIMVAVMARSGNSFSWLPHPWVVVACYVYVSCAALRLALYNVLAMQETKKSSVFHGLPSPGGAAAICSLVILFRSGVDSAIVNRLIQILPFYAVILGGLMVSSLPYVHFGKWLGSKRRNKIKIFLLIVFAGLLCYRPPLVAAIAVNVYILSGPVLAIFSWRRDGGEKAPAKDPA